VLLGDQVSRHFLCAAVHWGTVYDAATVSIQSAQDIADLRSYVAVGANIKTFVGADADDWEWFAG
jgi:hypothetical protein